MSGAACTVCGGVDGAACPRHHDPDHRACFSIFPPKPLPRHEPPSPPTGALPPHEFLCFGHHHDDHESVAALLFDDPPPDDHHHRSSTFHPFVGSGYHPAAAAAGTDGGLTFEVSLGRGEVDTGLGLGRRTEPPASDTIGEDDAPSFYLVTVYIHLVSTTSLCHSVGARSRMQQAQQPRSQS